jgi:hypothetical protein
MKEAQQSCLSKNKDFREIRDEMLIGRNGNGKLTLSIVGLRYAHHQATM